MPVRALIIHKHWQLVNHTSEDGKTKAKEGLRLIPSHTERKSKVGISKRPWGMKIAQLKARSLLSTAVVQWSGCVFEPCLGRSAETRFSSMCLHPQGLNNKCRMLIMMH